MGLDKMWEVKKRLEQFNRNLGMAGMRVPPDKGSKYEDRYKRITLYLDNDLYTDLQTVRSQGISQSLVVNVALKEFFDKNLSGSEQ